MAEGVKEITKDMIISDVINANPELIRTFFEHGMMCIGCPASQGESIEQASTVHGIDTDDLIKALNEALKAQWQALKIVVTKAIKYL